MPVAKASHQEERGPEEQAARRSGQQIERGFRIRPFNGVKPLFHGWERSLMTIGQYKRIAEARPTISRDQKQWWNSGHTKRHHSPESHREQPNKEAHDNEARAVFTG